MDAKRAIAADEWLRKSELALAQNKNLDDAQKAKMMAELQAKKAEYIANGIKETASKTTSQSTFAVAQAPTGPKSEDELKIINEQRKALGLDNEKSPIRSYTENQKTLNRINAMMASNDPADRAAASIEMGNFIAAGLQQGSFTPEMVKTVFPSSLAMDAQSYINYIRSQPQGRVTDAQLQSMTKFLENKVRVDRETYAPQIADAVKRMEKAGIDPAALGLAPQKPQVSSFKPRT
jgi:hypothetical protein